VIKSKPDPLTRPPDTTDSGVRTRRRKDHRHSDFGSWKQNSAIGGLKVMTENGWFAARPSGTEDVYKIYAESFRGETHLRQIQEEAQAMITKVLKSAS